MVESGHEPNSLGSKAHIQHNQKIMYPIGLYVLFKPHALITKHSEDCFPSNSYVMLIRYLQKPYKQIK